MRLLSCLLVLALCGSVSAQPRRGAWTPSRSWSPTTYYGNSSYYRNSNYYDPSPSVPQTSAVIATDSTVAGSEGEALHEVNAVRQARGLRPFVHDPALTQGALRAAIARARGRVAGHTSNDFAYLPAGASASAAGCAAWPTGMGWGSCCTYDNYTYAGAAYAIGPDGNRYMHLFVR